MTRSFVQKHAPDAPVDSIDELAVIWDELVHRIIVAMFDLAAVDPLHINLREELILELAKLQLWLGEGVVEKRLLGRDVSLIDVASESEECLGPQGTSTINNTAQILFERIWDRRTAERWKPKSEMAIAREANPRQTTLAVKPVAKNHFITRSFIRDYWAQNGNILRWKRTDQSWSFAVRNFGKWGFSQKLYSDWLEAYFGLLEGDAKEPIQMLLDTKPLNSPQREALVGFLVLNVLRNPSFIDAVHSGITPKLLELGYGNDKEMPQKAYEAIFRNNDFYHKLAHPIMWSQWAIVESELPIFVLPDTFCSSGTFGNGLRLIVPLTPRHCFVTLRATEDEKRVIPLRIRAEDRVACRISDVLVGSAQREFLSHLDYRNDERGEKPNLMDVIQEIEDSIKRSEKGSSAASETPHATRESQL